MKKIGKKTILRHVIDRVLKAKSVDKVIVASPQKLPRLPVEIFIGEENDVLKRYYDCAVKYNADVIVRITADCPFIDPIAIDLALAYYFSRPLQYVCFAPFDGCDVEVFGRYLLNEAHFNAKSQEDREHVTPYMRRITKLSIDTKEDLIKARRFHGLL